MLYTDVDVMFVRDLNPHDDIMGLYVRKAFNRALTPADADVPRILMHGREGVNKGGMNSGVLLMNAPGMAEEWPRFHEVRHWGWAEVEAPEGGSVGGPWPGGNPRQCQ